MRFPSSTSRSPIRLSAFRNIALLAILATAVGLGATEASASEPGNSWSGGWDWDGLFPPGAFVSNNWFPIPTAWALEVKGNSISENVLVSNYYPPPREPWCGITSQPSLADCHNFNLSLHEWTHDFLNIPDANPLPNNLPAFPQACASSCLVM